MNTPHDSQDIAARLEAAGRRDTKMLKDGQLATAEEQQALLDDFKNYMTAEGLKYPEAGRRLGGVSPSTLSEVMAGKYKGDTRAVLDKIDRLLDEEHARSGGPHFPKFSAIALTAQINGTFNTAIALGSNGVIIGESGCCKTSHAIAFAQQRPNTWLIRVEDEPADRVVVSRLLCQTLTKHRGHKELAPYIARPHSQRVGAIKEFLSRYRSAVLLVDEAQKLSANGLEFLRDLHDSSDPSGQRPMPIIFLGDQRFLRLIADTKNGKTTKLTAQLASRMYPIFEIDKHVADNMGGKHYTVEDVLAITRNSRLRVLSRTAVRWLTQLANVPGHGRLRLMMSVLRGACMYYATVLESGQTLEVEHLQESFKLAVGAGAAGQIDAATDGELLRKVG